MAFVEGLGRDLRFHHRLRFGEGPLTVSGGLRILVTSRGFFVLAGHRLRYRCHEVRRERGRGPLWLALRLQLLVGDPLTMIVGKADIQAFCEVEPGVVLSDRGHLVIGARRIGAGSIIHDHVTIGLDVTRRGWEIPSIGRSVWIGPNSVIHGDIEIGDGATIMPDTVLSKSVPERTVVMGNPARFVLRDFDNRALLSSLSVVESISELTGCVPCDP